MISQSLKWSIKSPSTLLLPRGNSIDIILFLLNQTSVECVLYLTLFIDYYIRPVLCIMKETLDISTPSMLSLQQIQTPEASQEVRKALIRRIMAS